MVNVVNQADQALSEPTVGASPHTVACIDILAPGGAPGADAPAAGTVLDQLKQAVRADDRICPMAVSRLAVEFGTVASGVLPQVLGDRLARAVGRRPTTEGASSATLTVSVGMAEPEPHLRSVDLVHRALAAARAGSRHLGDRPFAGTRTVVTVDRLLATGPTTPDPTLTFQSIHRRSVYRYESGHLRGVPSRPFGPVRPPRVMAVRSVGAPLDLAVLVVDPMGADGRDPGLAALTVASVTEQLGCRTTAVAVSPDDQLTLAIDGEPLDLVVITLDGGWVGHSPTWSTGTWGAPARLTTSYRASGVPVLAVSIGAGAGALASCVAQGALALFTLDHLPEALASLGSIASDEALQLAEFTHSSRFQSLISLTTSERRVLFYLTEGWAAQDIADELVVSLTTVRSHIRSVLRKLGVRSQLAAVAVANSRDLQFDASGATA
ncbi:MAG: helix-turn-helix transcriptional regulator [Acidimicrobiales bacterium]